MTFPFRRYFNTGPGTRHIHIGHGKQQHHLIGSDTHHIHTGSGIH